MSTINVTGMTTVLEMQGGQTGMVTLVGAPGAPGAPGPAGPDSNVVQYTAAVALGGHRVVVLNDDSEAIYADCGIPAHSIKILGLTTGAASAGGTATIRTGGEITEPGWTWTLNQPIYLGTAGVPTQTPPVSGFVLIVGFPITVDTMFVDLGASITLI